MAFSRKTLLLTLITLVALLGAFSLGRMVAADSNVGPAPGSAEDPLVSRSYVDSRISSLEARVAELEKKLGGSGPATTTPPQPGTSGPVVEQKVYTKSGKNWANVRSEPNTGSAVIYQCYPGTALTLLETQGEWFMVRLPDGAIGFVSSTVAEIR
ncbi:MAG: SH3 domain-containing protein [Firmicutes bacterium]|nr:SH3 domain-containing protein [Bacillota bacterium]